jgi:hypothetical protein
MRFLFIILASVVWLHGTSAVAGGMLDRSTDGDGVAVSISSPFSDLPPGGCVPYQVNIRNDRSSSQTWRIFFQATSSISAGGATYYAQDLTVAPNASGTFDLAVPLPVVSEHGNIYLSVGVKGPGFKDASGFNQFFAYIYSYNSGATIPFCLIGDSVLGSAGTGSLQTFYKDLGETYYGSDIDAAHMPSDWRAYAGVARIILRDTEWLGLNSTQRAAVSDYVAQGGRLVLLTSESLDTRTPELQLPTPDAKPGACGFGQIAVQMIPSFPPETSFLQNLIEHDVADAPRAVDTNFSTWGLRDQVGTITVHTGFVFSFVVLFGVLVGPVNLFVFAKGNKRFRLFWTTPLISIVASLALITGILFTDGLGGSGNQLIAIFSLPGANREAVIQEQIARTAVLFSNRWHNDETYLISPVSIRSIEDAASPYGYRAYSGRENMASAADTYLQIGNDYSGNWFRSRSVSGQYIQAMRPSRSSLTVLNAAALSAGSEPPAVLSSFPATLSRVFLVDGQGHFWTCENLAPGHKATCIASSATVYGSFWATACGEAGGKLRPLLSATASHPGYFYAIGAPAADEVLPTLGEIHWQTDQGLYLGPWVASSTTGNGT